MDLDGIVALYTERKNAHAPAIARMEQFRAFYNGEINIPLPELDRNEQSFVPNLAQVGLDQLAMRVASTMPDVFFPPLGETKAAEERARKRRMGVLSWFDVNRMGLKLRRRARHLLGYSISPVMVVPNPKLGVPEWRVRDPLTTFPAPAHDPDDITPIDCVFSYKRSRGWLEKRYPATRNLLRHEDAKPDDGVCIIEYVDDRRWTLIAHSDKSEGGYGMVGNQRTVVLEDAEHRIGMCPVVVPGLINLDRPQGAFDGIMGIHMMQAKLMALAVIAAERGVLPEEWLVARPNETPQIVDTPDPRTGKPGLLKGGDLKEITPDPAFMSMNVVDRLERAGRVTASIPAEMGGESQTNVRTGRRGDAIMSAAVDFRIQEAQDILAESMEAEVTRGIHVCRQYFPGRSVYQVGSKKTEYSADDFKETDQAFVRYSNSGADINGLIIGVGQRVGMGTMSKRTAQEMDPMIEDPEREKDYVVVEAIEAAMLSSLQEQAAGGQIPPNDLARIMQLVKTNKMDLADAIMKAQEEAQERQATPVPEGDPAAQPGLSMPGMGAEAPPAIAPPTASQSNLVSLLGRLRLPTMTVPAEEQAGA